MSLQEAANDLLADMLKDLHTSQQGRFSKATAIKAMRFVNINDEIGNRCSQGNWPEFKKEVKKALNQ